MKLPHRRQFLHLAAGAAVLPAVLTHRLAQTYPTRPVRLIVAFAAGGAPDIIARLMGQWLSERLGQPIRHRESAGCRRQYRHRSRRESAAGWLHAPHGHSVNAINASVYNNLNFNFIRDIAPIANIARIPFSWKLIHRFRPRRFQSSSPTQKPTRARSTWHRPVTGLRSHVAGELFKMMAGVEMVHVPYRGDVARALPDLISGQVQVCSASCLRRFGYIRSRQVAALGGDERDALGGPAGCPDRGRLSSGL